MCVLPEDIESRSACSRARAIVHYKFDSEHWEYRESTGVDIGIDCILELTEQDKWTGNFLNCQVKGRSHPKFNKSGDYISIELKVSTVNYALSQSNSYVLLVVDLNDETIYYLPIQEYFIANKEYFNKLNGSQDKITLRVPTDNIVSNDDRNLQEIAKSRYVDGPGIALKRYSPENK